MHIWRSPGVRRLTRCILRSLIAGSILLGLGTPSGRAQTPVTLPQTLTNGGASWDIVNTGGTTNGRPSGGACDNSPGLAVFDAALLAPAKVDAFDHGLSLWINDNIFVPAAGTITRSGQTLTAGPSPLNGLNVTVQYAALAGSPTLRMLARLQNTNPLALTATVSLVSNLGSDATTVVTATSSGDPVFTPDDRWVITADSVTAPGDPVVTHVLAGPGAPSVRPTAVSQTVFGCLAPPFTQGVRANYTVTVPAGATRYLLFYAQLGATPSGAAAAAATFNTTPPLGSDLVSELDAAVLRNVVNWDFSALGPPDTPATPTPTPTLTPLPTRTPTPAGLVLPLPVIPPPPPGAPLPLVGGPPPPGWLPLPPAPVSGRAAPAAGTPAEVPVIPEAESLGLLGLGLASLLAGWALRQRRPARSKEHER
jgi:hypothetical protein